MVAFRKGGDCMATVAQQRRIPMGKGKADLQRRASWRFWFWAGPAVLIAVIFLFYPVLNTIWSSFFNFDTTEFVGLENFRAIFTNRALLEVLRNNLLWLLLATAGTVFLGLVVAVLVDRVKFESL